jgi:hypothetical protein
MTVYFSFFVVRSDLNDYTEVILLTSIYLSIYLSMPSYHVPRGVGREETAPFYSVSAHILRFLNSHAGSLTCSSAFRTSHSFFQDVLYPILGLPRLLSLILSALYIILVILSSFILSICPNHLSLFTFILSTILRLSPHKCLL